jgi:heme exporter protein B
VSPPRPPARVVHSALVIFRRELLAEWRSRVALNALFLFAFAVLVLVGYAVGPTRLAPEDRPTVNSVLLWIVLFFAAMTGLSRTFVHEEDAGTATALRLSAPAPSVLLGKLLANMALLSAVTAFVVPLFLVLMSFEILGVSFFLLLLVLGTFGLAAASTFTAALVSKANARGALFSVLAIPLLLPPLVACVLATRVASTQADFATGLDFVRLLVAYDGVVTTAAFLLFDAVWRE